MTALAEVVSVSQGDLAGRSWQQGMKDAVRDPVELCRLVELPQYEPGAIRAARLFPLFAPRSYIARMRPRDPHDPLLRQVLPLDLEESQVPGFSRDPVDDHGAAVIPGLLRKYQSRVLMVASGTCAVHCRYCFRRHFPYSQTPRSVRAWQPALDYIASDSTVHEVILSGGDPLTLVDDLLAELSARLARIGHLRRLRVHTRLPIMIPERVTEGLLSWLRGTRLTPVMVIHANHAAELQGTAAEAVGRIVDAGIPVLNQSVLLRGVNDDIETLVQLSERLVDLRVIPYYLHQLDRVAGAAHFEVPVSQGLQLMAQLRARLPGYTVPRYVQEVPGETSKLPLESETVGQALRA